VTELALKVYNKELGTSFNERNKRISKGALIGGGVGLVAGLFLGNFRGFLTVIGVVAGIMIITSNDNGKERKSTMERK